MRTITKYMQSRAIDPLTQTVRVDSSENSVPVLINLNQLFGSSGLRYHVAVEDYGRVNVVLSTRCGELYIAPGELASHGSSTRLAIRATDREGDSVATTILVKVEDGDFSEVAA